MYVLCAGGCPWADCVLCVRWHAHQHWRHSEARSPSTEAASMIGRKDSDCCVCVLCIPEERKCVPVVVDACDVFCVARPSTTERQCSPTVCVCVCVCTDTQQVHARQLLEWLSTPRTPALCAASPTARLLKLIHVHPHSSTQHSDTVTTHTDTQQRTHAPPHLVNELGYLSVVHPLERPLVVKHLPQQDAKAEHVARAEHCACVGTTPASRVFVKPLLWW